MKMNRIIIILCILLITIAGCSRKVEQQAKGPIGATQEMDVLSQMPIVEEVPEETDVQQTVTEPITSIRMPTGPSVFEKPNIKDIQKALKNANLYQGKIDGVFGPKTKKAVEDFQAQNDLKVDGNVGPMTWQKLKPYLNKVEERHPS